MSKLIGTNPNQVPSNADLGTAAFTDSNDYISALSKINSNIAATAVDVFVYDTRKDSDGGAWRKRTQHTSWYNEKLNTTTRGSRREFPAVAVIVATISSVTIYDGDDPTLPMWMVFRHPGASAGWIAYINVTYLGTAISSISAMNGVLGIGVNNSSYGGFLFGNFLADNGGTLYYGYDEFKFDGYISDRNSIYSGRFISSRRIVNRGVNDVAMTVLPNAPIDATTGLPIPTIAVGTNGGVSIIKDDGTVVNSGGSYPASKVAFNYNGNRLAQSIDVNTWDTIVSTDYLTPGFTGATAADYSQSASGWAKHLIIGNTSDNANDIVFSNDVLNLGFNTSNTLGLFKIAENTNSPSNGMLCRITSEYNTGWMPGNIKLAALSDTTQETVVSSELVTNGTFDSNVSGFSGTMGSVLSWDAGRAKSTAVSTEIGISYSLSGLIVGKTYVASCDLDSRFGNSGTYFSWLKNESWSNNLGNADCIDGVSVKVSTTFVATETSFVLSLVSSTGAISPGEYSYFDNFSVRIADADRSVNNKGLQVYGNIKKTPVAASADLVAYSGFSDGYYGADRLEQPYNSNLAFGSDDFSIQFWCKNIGTSSDIMGVGKRGSGDGAWFIYMDNAAGLRFTISENGTAYEDVIEIQFGSAITEWTHVCYTRTNGVYWNAYVNGRLNLSSVSTYSNVYASTAGLVIGAGNTNNLITNANHSLALVRISKTAPSAEQIKKMYEDERMLFQENAKATLYGTSNAVTALAYDDSTNLLHAGTSAGRSIFQGLRRIDNTTTAVGTAISASNGMVAEE